MSNALEALTYTNPLYPRHFADPFVWRYKDEYYAVGTGPAEASGETKEAEASSSAMPSIGSTPSQPTLLDKAIAAPCFRGLAR